MSRNRRMYFETEEVVKTTKRAWMDVPMDFIQLYHTAWRHSVQLTGVAGRDFLLWVCGQVDDNNQFTYTQVLLDRFNRDMKDACGREYEKNTIMTALREFVEKGIATRPLRGVYQLNPKIFWSGSMENRLNMIKAVEETKKIMDGEPLPVKTIDMEYEDAGNNQPVEGEVI